MNDKQPEDQMWARLAQHQPFADDRGYGPEWRTMCEERTVEAAYAARFAAWEAARRARGAKVAWPAADEAAWQAADAAATAVDAARRAERAVQFIAKAEGRT